MPPPNSTNERTPNIFRQEQIDGLRTLSLGLRNNADELSEARVSIKDYCEDAQQFVDPQTAQQAFMIVGEMRAIEKIASAVIDRLRELCFQMQYERNAELLHAYLGAISEDMDRDEKKTRVSMRPARGQTKGKRTRLLSA